VFGQTESNLRGFLSSFDDNSVGSSSDVGSDGLPKADFYDLLETRFANESGEHEKSDDSLLDEAEYVKLHYRRNSYDLKQMSLEIGREIWDMKKMLAPKVGPAESPLHLQFHENSPEKDHHFSDWEKYMSALGSKISEFVELDSNDRIESRESDGTGSSRPYTRTRLDSAPKP
jgi:hypothetical protein